jgi:hypothetical protein
MYGVTSSVVRPINRKQPQYSFITIENNDTSNGAIREPRPEAALT